MIPIEVIGTRSCNSIYALLDEGSSVSLINAKVIEKIGAKMMRVNVSLKGIGSAEAIAMASEKVNLQIKSHFLIFTIKNVLVVSDLALPVQRVHGGLVRLYCEKTGIDMRAYNTAPDMLFGQDNCDLIVTREFQVIIGKSLLISRCSLGWSIHGSYNRNIGEQVNVLSLL